MQELEKILKEIEILSLGKYYIETEKIKEIIRKHMNDGWVPVEERLPEEQKYYLVTAEDNGAPFVDCRWHKYGGKFNCEDGEAIIAWQPLPGPYRPGEKESEQNE